MTKINTHTKFDASTEHWLRNHPAFRSDSDIGFFARDLDYVKAQTYDILYPALKATQLIPVSSEAPFGIERIVYGQYDFTGEAKIISDFADDFPAADSFGKEFAVKPRIMGAGYNYNMEEIAASRYTGRGLDVRRARAARLSIEQKMNRIGWTGQADAGLKGLLSSDNNIPQVEVAATGEGSSTLWEDKTPQQILTDIRNANSAILSDTKGVHAPDTLILPIKQYNNITTQPYSDQMPTLTVYRYILDNIPNINRIEWVNEMENAGPSDSDVFVLYQNSPDILQFEIPVMLMQLQPQQKNMQIIINMFAQTAGVSVYYPKSAYIGTGI